MDQFWSIKSAFYFTAVAQHNYAYGVIFTLLERRRVAELEMIFMGVVHIEIGLIYSLFFSRLRRITVV